MNRSILPFLAAYAAAGGFAVAFIQTALESPLQQQSGTQVYNRVSR